MSNRGVEVVDESHLMNIPINEDNHCIQDEWVKKQKWTQAELVSGKFHTHRYNILRYRF
jgi:hypothetical protein